MEKRRLHAYCSDVMGSADATDIAAKIKRREVSAEEVVKAAITRARSVDDTLNGIEIDCFEQATAQSRHPGEGRFSGIPIFIKDNIAFKGLPTNHGSNSLRSQPAKAHSAYTRQLMDQGFIALGKSRLSEFGLSPTTEPAHAAPTRNPWNIDYSAGGSSSGSAVLVASGVVPIAHAVDGGGSIRIPAACCGLVGLTPSRHRHKLSEQFHSLPIGIVREGILSRSVRDTAYFYAEAEKYCKHPGLPEIGLIEGASPKRLRIGMVINSVTDHQTDGATQGAVEQTAGLLSSAGHHIEHIKLPIDRQFASDFETYWSMCAFLVKKLGKYTIDRSFDPEKLDAFSLGLARRYTRQLHKTFFCLRRLKKIHHIYRQQFNHYDAVLSPVLGQTTRPLGELAATVPFDVLIERIRAYACFTPLANVTGAPAMSIPIGKTERGDLPIGVQLCADYGDEKTLLELAFELEEMTGGFRKIEG